jgi:hypothetical protein
VRQKRHVLGTAVLVLLPLAAGCATAGAGLTPSASVTTAVQGWENWLSLEWTAQAQPAGQEIVGYIYSHRGTPIADVQLLAQGLDGSGAVVGQRIARVPGGVPGLQRSYFRISGLPPAERYRVTVWTFESVESNSWE